MKRLLWIAVVLSFVSGLCLAAPVQDTAHQPSLITAAASIRTELEAHGERVMGKDVYHWSTRLERIEACRAEFSVRVANHYGEVTLNLENVNFSLGALDPDGIAIQPNRGLKLPCRDKERCVVSSSTCTRTSKEGIVIDCTVASRKQEDSFSMELDGNAESAQRLQQAMVQAVSNCQQASQVNF